MASRAHRVSYRLTMSRRRTTIVLFRYDLRLADNPALSAAAARGAVVPLYVWSPAVEQPWSPGSASRWWLHQSLTGLEASLGRSGSRLTVRQGELLPNLRSVIRESGATRVYVNRRYEPPMGASDAEIERALHGDGVQLAAFDDATLFPPGQVLTREGKPFQVFTPFWRACLSRPAPAVPIGAPGKLEAPARWPTSETVESLGLLPRIDWTGGLRATWSPGEAAAEAALKRFAASGMVDYAAARDRVDVDGTSRLSPHIRFGEVSVRQVWHMASGVDGESAERFLREIGWREFAHHLLWAFPHTTERPLREAFDAFEWRDDRAALRSWQRGATGYPIVDAAMRQLWATGWMPNRLRMVVASFLTKHLLIPWQAGARWFWDTLVDADLANNTLGWQWTAGCGADAAPYFRIFNPVAQASRFDPDGTYIRRWAPELAGVCAPAIFAPWEASPRELAAAGVRLGETYPAPVVDHRAARERALSAYGRLRRV